MKYLSFSIFLFKFFLGVFLCLLYTHPTFASQIRVENVFSDIKSDYKYRDELQLLFDRGMIYPDENGKFSPNQLLDRDEFVGISMEVICKRCIQPHTEIEYIKKYASTKPYYDIDSKNKYFYCVAEADASNYVKGYDASYRCEDGTQRDGERPFCTNNKITFEEAVAVLLRNSNIFTIEDNEYIRNQISSGASYPILSDDVGPKNTDGTTYTFYGYFQKALDFKLVEYDSLGRQKTYTMIEKVDNKIRPKKNITKEEFLRIAYVALKSNSCTQIQDNKIALAIDIWEKSCKPGDTNCVLSQLNDPKDTYDFTPQVEGFCSEGIDNPSGYIWRFYNLTTGVEFFKYGKYIDNLLLPTPGERRIYLTVIDKCGNSGQVYSTIMVKDIVSIDSIVNIALNVDIVALPIIGYKNLLVDYTALTFGGTAPFSYSWDFGDASQGVGRKTTHIFTQTNVFQTSLNVVDSKGLRGSATVLIKVLEGNCKTDSDGDGTLDCDDKCPDIPGLSINSACPIVEKPCSSSGKCPVGYTCNIKKPVENAPGVCLPDIPALQTCLYSPTKSSIFGNASCNSCPCSNFADFFADVRKCDVVFPAITSPNAQDIYSRGDTYQIRN